MVTSKIVKRKRRTRDRRDGPFEKRLDLVIMDMILARPVDTEVEGVVFP